MNEQTEQEPVAWRDVAGKTTKYYDYNEQGRGEPLYTAPPKREWVGLTDEEKEEATGWSVERIEAKLKEKNT